MSVYLGPSSPLEQFLPLLRPTIFGKFHLYWLSNTSYNIIFVYVLLAFLLYLSSSNVTEIGFVQFVMQKLFLLVKLVCESNIKINKQVYVLDLYIKFMFILLSNLIGLFPYSFSLTSHFSVTFFLSYSFFLSTVIIGFKVNGWRFFKILLPVKVPLFIAPILICVEVVSFFLRPLSLAVRLSANMLSGHILLKILAIASWGALSSGNFLFIILSFIPVIILFLVMLLELMIAFLQAYVFLVLMTIYLNEAINI